MEELTWGDPVKVAVDKASAQQARVASFLADLSDVTRTHGIRIGGCGCCGSPYLYQHKDGPYPHGVIEQYLSWDSEEQRYVVYVDDYDPTEG